jgi:hypothetical protein
LCVYPLCVGNEPDKLTAAIRDYFSERYKLKLIYFYSCDLLAKNGEKQLEDILVSPGLPSRQITFRAKQQRDDGCNIK